MFEMTLPVFPWEKVKPLREATGLTQTEFAHELGVSQPLVAKWESGRNKPRGPVAILLGQLESKVEVTSDQENLLVSVDR